MNIRHKAISCLNSISRHSPHHSINYSFKKLLQIKLGVLTSFAVNRVLVERGSRKALHGTKTNFGRFQGKIAIVVANGPSSNDVNWNKVNIERKLGNCSLFLINHSLNDLSMLERGADFLVLSDPGSHPLSKDPRTVKLWKNISVLQDLQLITPVSWHLQLGDRRCLTRECFHFSDLSLESLSTSTSPLKARGYPSLTAYKAIAFAKHLGFSTILIAGVDNSMFRTIQVDSSNSLIQASNHFVENYGPKANVSTLYPNGIADYFAELSEMFLSLRRSFSNTEIFNLGLHSEVDAFPKATEDTLWHKFIIQND